MKHLSENVISARDAWLKIYRLRRIEGAYSRKVAGLLWEIICLKTPTPGIEIFLEEMALIKERDGTRTRALYQQSHGFDGLVLFQAADAAYTAVHDDGNRYPEFKIRAIEALGRRRKLHR